MERRTFFKNLLGAAVIATLPATIVKAIEKSEPIIKPIKYKKRGLIVLDADNNLVGWSGSFDLSMHRDVLELTDREHFLRTKGTIETTVHADYFYTSIPVQWFDLIHTPLQIIIRSDTYKILGEAYINSISSDAETLVSVDFQVCGALTMIEEKGDK